MLDVIKTCEWCSKERVPGLSIARYVEGKERNEARLRMGRFTLVMCVCPCACVRV